MGKQNMALLRERGYKGAVAETASNFSQKAAEKNGFTPFKRVDYQSFVTDSGEHFFAPVQAPHTTFTLWEARCNPGPEETGAEAVVYVPLTGTDADAAVDLASRTMGLGEPVFQYVL